MCFKGYNNQIINRGLKNVAFVLMDKKTEVLEIWIWL
jgi:hypothetical protein